MASIKCGSCKQYHSSVADVRACYARKYKPAEILGAPEMAVSQRLEAQGTPVDDIRSAALRLPNVAVAHYAILEERLGEFAGSVEKIWRFYRVDRPQTGKWAGYTFVKVQASDDFHPVKNLRKVAAILTAIAFDPQSAAEDYGHQLGRCSICNRTLTDDASIKRGIGPVCADKVGW